MEGFSCPDPPLTDLPVSCSPIPREVLGLVDLVALENGELGPLLSPGTLRGLEDECVTDVKVLGDLGAGGSLQGGRALTGFRGLSSPPFATPISLFRRLLSSAPKTQKRKPVLITSILGLLLLRKQPARHREHQ